MESLDKYSSTFRGINFTSSDNGCSDSIGHGTAIIDTILRVENNVEIIMCKIFEDVPENDASALIRILEYIYENVECNILHMSFGITQCEQFSKLKAICDSFVDKQTIMVSAFDNMGSVSYPAAFNNVVGVDSCRSSYAKNNYIFIDGSIVNIDLNIGMRRVKVKNENKIFIGSSFSAAHITGLIAKHLNAGVGKNRISEELKANAAKIIEYPIPSREKTKVFDIKKVVKAIAFPFNKEMHSLVRVC